MQLIPETAERFSVADILDPAQNIRGGVRYLRWLLAYFRGDVDLALAAYNAGEGTVDRFGGIPPYQETMAYVNRIRALYPHDRHPFDPQAAVRASPVVPAALPAGRPEVAAPVRYFLGTVGPDLAKSHR
jgi:membrane-bound lytic murein transglycosylase MltF